MQQAQQTIDQATGAAVSSISAAGALVTAQNWALALFGVPLFVVLAGFAGVFYGITFREAVAAWVCAHLLNQFDPKGRHC